LVLAVGSVSWLKCFIGKVYVAGSWLSHHFMTGPSSSPKK
jgi:hypothetical protein